MKVSVALLDPCRLFIEIDGRPNSEVTMKRCIPFTLAYDPEPACERRWTLVERCRAHFDIGWPTPYPLDADLIGVTARDTALCGLGEPLWTLVEEANRRFKADEAWTLRSLRIRGGLKLKAARDQATHAYLPGAHGTGGR